MITIAITILITQNIIYYKMAIQVIVFWKGYRKLARKLAKWRRRTTKHTVILKMYHGELNIKDFTNSKNADYLLIIGSIEEVPSVMLNINEKWASSVLNKNVKTAASDISYGVVDGVLQTVVGRLSSGDNVYGKSSGELTAKQKRRNIGAQIQKIIKYEKSLKKRSRMKKRGKLTERVVGIASSEGNGYGLDGMSDKVFLHNEMEKMYNDKGTVYNEFFDGNQVGGSEGVGKGVVLDSKGNPNGGGLVKIMNKGVGISGLFYTGHANEVSLSTSGFDIDDISKLRKRKGGMGLFVGCSVGCSVGSHDENYMSLAEALQCARLRGSVAFFGSTILQSWMPPMSMQRVIMRNFGNVDCVGELFRKGMETDKFRNATDFWFYTLFGDPLLKMN